MMSQAVLRSRAPCCWELWSWPSRLRRRRAFMSTSAIMAATTRITMGIITRHTTTHAIDRTVTATATPIMGRIPIRDPTTDTRGIAS